MNNQKLIEEAKRIVNFIEEGTLIAASLQSAILFQQILDSNSNIPKEIILLIAKAWLERKHYKNVIYYLKFLETNLDSDPEIQMIRETIKTHDPDLYQSNFN